LKGGEGVRGKGGDGGREERGSSSPYRNSWIRHCTEMSICANCGEGNRLRRLRI